MSHFKTKLHHNHDEINGQEPVLGMSGDSMFMVRDRTRLTVHKTTIQLTF